TGAITARVATVGEPGILPVAQVGRVAQRLALELRGQAPSSPDEDRAAGLLVRPLGKGALDLNRQPSSDELDTRRLMLTETPPQPRSVKSLPIVAWSGLGLGLTLAASGAGLLGWDRSIAACGNSSATGWCARRYDMTAPGGVMFGIGGGLAIASSAYLLL